MKSKEELAVYQRSWRHKNAERYRAYKRAWNTKWRAKNKDKIRASTAEQRRKWPEKYKARGKVSNAIRDGRLTRKPCEVCGSKAEAHHEDYSRPLEVTWLCPLHHHILESPTYSYKGKANGA